MWPWLALQGLRTSRTFVLLVLAIALAAGFQISNTALLAGFETDFLDDALAHGNGDVRITPRDQQRFEDGAAEAAALASFATAAEPVLVLAFPGAVAGADQRFRPVELHGIDPRTPRPPFRVVAGSALGPGDDAGVLLGTAIAARLEAGVGDHVELRAILGPRDPSIDDANVVAIRATVRGIVTGTSGAYRIAYVDRATLARAAGMPAAASTVLLHLRDHTTARAVAQAIEAQRPELEARAWLDDDQSVAAFLGARRTIGGISYAMVIAAIAIPTWALLYIHVLRRQRELAILAALGFPRRELLAIYALQSGMIAVVGCVLGAGLGYGLTRYFAAHPLFQWESLTVRPALSLAAIVVPCAIIVGTALVAALHPAARAARVVPAVALRRIE